MATLAEKVLTKLRARQVRDPVPIGPTHPPNLSEGIPGHIARPEASGATAVVDGIPDDDGATNAQAVMPPPSMPDPLPPGEGEEALAVGDRCAACRENGKISHLWVLHHGAWRCWKCLRSEPEGSADHDQTPDLRHHPEAPQASDDALETAYARYAMAGDWAHRSPQGYGP